MNIFSNLRAIKDSLRMRVGAELQQFFFITQEAEIERNRRRIAEQKEVSLTRMNKLL